MASNLKYSEAIVQKLRKRLSKICAGDIPKMMAALDVVCNRSQAWGSRYQHYVQDFKKAIATPPWYPKEEDVIIVANQLREKLVENTTEKMFPRREPDTTENSPKQLTLNFSDTTEKTLQLPPAATGGGEAVKTPGQRDSEQLICKKYNSGQRECKGWLTPQYKYTSVFGYSHTSTNPEKLPEKRVYGPYWVFCWYRPGKNDGHFYLGRVESKKFQHFSVVWQQCDSAAEILKLLRKGSDQG